jgi:UDP-glucose 4-epimerase
VNRPLSVVTGGAGFLGAALVRELLARGHQVRVVDDLSRGHARRLDGLDLELVHGDLTDPDCAKRTIAGAEVVWHLAAVNGTRNFYERPDRVIEVGIAATLHTINAALDTGARRYVFASSSEVYQTPPICPTPEDVPAVVPDVHNPRYSYGGSKIAGELLTLHLARPRGLETVIVRPHNFYGPDMGNDHVIPELSERLAALMTDSSGWLQLPIQGDGTETRAFCHVTDGARGVSVAGLDGPDGAIFHVGSDDEITIRELATRMGRVLGVPVDVIPGDAPAGATPRRCPDTTALRALGWEPEVDLDAGLRDTMAWYGCAPYLR